MYSYEPLWDTMRKKNKTTYWLMQNGILSKTIYNLQHNKNVTVLEGLAVSRDVISNDQSETVTDWLKELGLK